jgi:hypothetical protein
MDLDERRRKETLYISLILCKLRQRNGLKKEQNSPASQCCSGTESKFSLTPFLFSIPSSSSCSLMSREDDFTAAASVVTVRPGSSSPLTTAALYRHTPLSQRCTEQKKPASYSYYHTPFEAARAHPLLLLPLPLYVQKRESVCCCCCAA